jgi:N-succinyldiaminopimelate aminotransferase
LNSLLDSLKPYPFEKLRLELASVVPNKALSPVNLSIGEPKHPTPDVITKALINNLAGLSAYPATAGTLNLRVSMADWLKRRHRLTNLDAATQVLPVNGSREALFAFAQTVLDTRRKTPETAAKTIWVVSPNPFYQIYEGAALLAGAKPFYIEQSERNDFRCDWRTISDAIWADTQLLFVCSPGNPTGSVMPQAEWDYLFEKSKQFGFVIASDECYSEIYFDEARPPLGALQAAQVHGLSDYARLVIFSSLSKRSNVPGMRSGLVAGDAALIKAFLLYRTYHGSAMSQTIQAASIAAWDDEAHVIANRSAYKEKFEAITATVNQYLPCQIPEAGFYLWAKVPSAVLDGDDLALVKALYRDQNLLLLPGSLLGRISNNHNPGAGFVRLALVENLNACIEGADRIRNYFTQNK